MEHKKKLEELHRESLQKLEEFVQAKKTVKKED